MYGVIEYDENGLIKCEICGLYFARPTAHARQKHNITAKEYKKQFGLDNKKGVISKYSAQLSRDRVMENYDRVVSENLISGGIKSRFKEGDSGRTKDQVSAQTRARLIARLKEPKMIKAMKKSGHKLGKSGTGNAARWKTN